MTERRVELRAALNSSAKPEILAQLGRQEYPGLARHDLEERTSPPLYTPVLTGKLPDSQVVERGTRAQLSHGRPPARRRPLATDLNAAGLNVVGMNNAGEDVVYGD